MAITQIIATLPAVLNDSATFYEDIAERNNSLVTTVLPSINAWALQANTTQSEINAKAAQVAAQAVDGGYSQNYINSNFVGVNNAQDITAIKTFTVSPIVPTPTTDYQVANKQYVDDNNKINTLTNKTTPVDADNFALQETGGLLKKLSFANLSTWIKSFSFGWGQTLQNVTGSRSLGVIYTNATGKPMTVIISTTTTTTNKYLTVYVDAIEHHAVETVGSGANASLSLPFTVNPGSTYSLISASALSAWREYR